MRRKSDRIANGAFDAEPNLGTIARAVWANKRRIIGPTLVIAAAAFIVVNLMTPKYKSESRVLVEGRENIFLRADAEKSMTDRAVVDQEAVTSQVQLVLSRDLARDVVQKLKLDEVSEFTAASELSAGSVLRMVGLGKDPASMSVDERVLAAYFERLSAYPIDKSRVIAIEFKSADPDLAARAANVIAESYLTLQQVVKQDQARAAGQWLSGELEKLRGKVSEAEAKVEEFRAKSNLFMGANNTTLSNLQLGEVNTQVSQLRAQKADAEAKARLIRDTLRSGQSIESSEITNSELIRRLAEQRITLRAQLAEQSSTLLPQHPRIRELRAQVADLDNQIRQEGERLVRTLEADAKIADARLQTLTASLDQLKRQAASTSDQDVQLRALEREAKAQRDLFESYLAKYREASARDSIAAAPADARIISRAMASTTPFFPKKLPIVIIAALATFSLCSAFVVTGALLSAPEPTRVAVSPVAERRQDETPVVVAEPAVIEPRNRSARTRAADRVEERAAELAALAETPQPSSKRSFWRGQAAAPVQASAHTMVNGAASIDSLAQSLLSSGEAARPIAVLGAARETGTTMTAIALARSLARQARVVLVDLAFASPNIDVISSDPNARGIADLVRGAASFSDVITRDRFSKVHLVAAGSLQGPADDLMSSHMLLSALDALAQSYNCLVVDAGAQADVSLDALMQIAPRIVLVAGEGPATTAEVLRGQLLAEGFSDVTILTGPPPGLDHASTQSAAA